MLACIRLGFSFSEDQFLMLGHPGTVFCGTRGHRCGNAMFSMRFAGKPAVLKVALSGSRLAA